MSWGFPSALFLLFAVIPAIIILHTLRPRGVRVGTSALFIWERVLKERQMGQWLGRLLRKNLALLLQLLAAIALIAALPYGGNMMIIGAGPRPQILSTWSGDAAHLRAVARSARATDAAAPVKDAVLFAHSFLKRGGGDRVMVVSDGAFDGAEELPWNSGHLAL